MSHYVQQKLNAPKNVGVIAVGLWVYYEIFFFKYTENMKEIVWAF